MFAVVAGLGGYLLASGNESEQVTESMTKAINDVLTEFTTNVSNQVRNTQNARQELKASFVGADISCDITIDQTMKNTMQSLTQLDNEQLSDLSNKITNKLKEALEQQNKQLVDGLALGKNSSKQVLDTTTITENNIKTKLTTSIENIIENKNDAMQVQVAMFDKSICRKGASISISQDMIIEQISKNMAENIVQNVLTNEAKNELEKEVTQKNEQTVKGWGLGLMCLCMLCCLSSCMSVGVAYVKAKKMLPFILMIIGFVMIVSGSSSIYLSQRDPEDKDSMSQEDKDKYEKAAKTFLVSGIIFVLFGLLLLGVGGAMLVGGFGSPESEDINVSQLPKLPDSMSLPKVR